MATAKKRTTKKKTAGRKTASENLLYGEIFLLVIENLLHRPHQRSCRCLIAEMNHLAESILLLTN